MLKDKIILITGGCGAIGSNLANTLSADNRIVIIDNLTSGRSENIIANKNISVYKKDIRDTEILDRIFGENRIDIVFHLASNFANASSVDNPVLDLEVNGKGTLLLLKYAEKYKTGSFIYTSSSCVYGSAEGDMTEDKTGDLETPYAVTKLLGEYYTNFFHRHYNLNIVNVRLFNSYGPGELWGMYRNVIPNFFYRALRKEPLIITGTGEETRDFNFVRDIVSGLIKASECPGAVGETINLGSGKETAITYLAVLINKLCNNDGNIHYIPRRNWDKVSRRKADVTKAENILGWKSETPLEEGLRIYHEWIKRIFDDTNNNARIQ